MDTTPGFPTLSVVRHPLVQHKLTILRDRATDTKTFKDLVDEIAMLMAYEATSDLALEDLPVETPLERCVGKQVAGKKLTLVPILRAGLGMVEAAADILPRAEVWHLGMYRDEETKRPVSYYNKLPPTCPNDLVFLLDPMLATGGSAVDAISVLKDWGAREIKFVGIIAAPEGVRNVQAHHPDVPLYVAALDRELDENRFIRPGLGDAGDRLFGTHG